MWNRPVRERTMYRLRAECIWVIGVEGHVAICCTGAWIYCPRTYIVRSERRTKEITSRHSWRFIMSMALNRLLKTSVRPLFYSCFIQVFILFRQNIFWPGISDLLTCLLPSVAVPPVWTHYLPFLVIVWKTLQHEIRAVEANWKKKNIFGNCLQI